MTEYLFGTKFQCSLLVKAHEKMTLDSIYFCSLPLMNDQYKSFRAQQQILSLCWNYSQKNRVGVCQYRIHKENVNT